MQFYIKFEDKALYGIILSTVLFVYLGSLVLYLSSKLKTNSYENILKYLLGKKLSKFMDAVSLFMLAGGLGIMIAGSGAVFNEYLGTSKYIGALLAAILTCAVLCGGLQGVLNVNAVLVPVKLLVIIIVCIYALCHTGIITVPEHKNTIDAAGNWAWSAILYVSYNMIIPVAVLSSLGETVNKKTGVMSGIIGGLALGGTAAIITLAGLAHYPQISQYQVPLLHLAQQTGYWCQKLLALLIWLAILTTAIANAHGFASRLAPHNSRRYKLIGVGLVITLFPFSLFEFTQLIKNVYPFFGYFGLILILGLIITPVIIKK